MDGRTVTPGEPTRGVDGAAILSASRAGQVLECGHGGVHALVDAATIRHVCQDLKDQVDPRGIWLRNAAVSGSLDFTAMEVPFPVRFEQCKFESPVILEGARLYGLGGGPSHRRPT